MEGADPTSGENVLIPFVIFSFFFVFGENFCKPCHIPGLLLVFMIWPVELNLKYIKNFFDSHKCLHYRTQPAQFPPNWSSGGGVLEAGVQL